MTTSLRILASGAILALALGSTTTASDAAWWPWSKKKDVPAPTQTAPQPEPPAAVGPDGTAVVVAPDQPDRMTRLEDQLRDLTGQVETLTHQVQGLQQQLQSLQANAGGPLRKQSKPAAIAAKVEPAAGDSQDSGAIVAPAAPQQEAVAAPAAGGGQAADTSDGTGAAPQPLGTLTLDPNATGNAAGDAGQPMDITPLPPGGVAAAPAAEAPAQPVRVVGPATAETKVMASLGNGDDYEQAYNNILTGDYDQAEASFRAFLNAHPQDARASDAQYWIGESLFERGKYREAANEFLNGHKAYPNSGKGADTLLKLGLSLAGLGERDAACSTYAQVLKQYPEVSNALRQRVKAEQASASC